LGFFEPLDMLGLIDFVELLFDWPQFVTEHFLFGFAISVGLGPDFNDLFLCLLSGSCQMSVSNFGWIWTG
jgi:hypothetical protein